MSDIQDGAGPQRTCSHRVAIRRNNGAQQKPPMRQIVVQFPTENPAKYFELIVEEYINHNAIIINIFTRLYF